MGAGAQASVKASRFSRKGVADSRRVAEAVKAGAREKGRNQKNPESPFSQSPVHSLLTVQNKLAQNLRRGERLPETPLLRQEWSSARGFSVIWINRLGLGQESTHPGPTQL